MAVDVDPDGGACVHRVGDGLDADPKPGEAREIEALHAELDHFRDIGGVQTGISASMKAKSLWFGRVEDLQA